MAYGSIDGVTGAGAFATARRGGMTGYEIERAKELKDRRHGVQSIARILGRPQEDISRLFEAANVCERPVEKERKVEIPQPVLRFGFSIREARLFDAFAAGGLLSDDEIVRLVAGRLTVDGTYVTTLIRRLRIKTQPFGLRIVNVKGRGYRLTPESLEKLAADPGMGKPKTPARCGAEAYAILEEVANDHGLTVTDLRCRSRNATRIAATRDAMYRLHQTGKYSLLQIGLILDRDHTSVSAGVKLHRRDMAA